MQVGWKQLVWDLSVRHFRFGLSSVFTVPTMLLLDFYANGLWFGHIYVHKIVEVLPKILLDIIGWHCYKCGFILNGSLRQLLTVVCQNYCLPKLSSYIRVDSTMMHAQQNASLRQTFHQSLVTIYLYVLLCIRVKMSPSTICLMVF